MNRSTTLSPPPGPQVLDVVLVGQQARGAVVGTDADIQGLDVGARGLGHTRRHLDVLGLDRAARIGRCRRGRRTVFGRGRRRDWSRVRGGHHRTGTRLGRGRAQPHHPRLQGEQRRGANRINHHASPLDSREHHTNPIHNICASCKQFVNFGSPLAKPSRSPPLDLGRPPHEAPKLIEAASH